jgi:hypothetical protein
MFSGRVPFPLASNRLARAVSRARTEGHRLIDLTESNPTRAGFDYPPDLLTPLAHARGLLYDPRPLGLPDAREAVAEDYRRRGVAVHADRIALVPSTSDAYSVLFKMLADPGDEVLVPRPSYPLLEHLVRLDAIRAKTYGLDYHGVWEIDVAGLERAITSRTRAVLVVSPNNPTGSFLSRTERDAVAALCEAHGLALIADEVFADYELKPGASARAARILDDEGGLTFSLGGLSKSIGLPQLKLAWIACGGHPSVVEPALERLEFLCDAYLSVSVPVQGAARELLERGAPVRKQIRRRVAANHLELIRRVAAVSCCTVLGVDAGWYAIVQVPSLGSEEDLVVDLVERDGVVTHPGYFFDFVRESYLVVSLLPPESVFADGVGRLLRRFGCGI